MKKEVWECRKCNSRFPCKKVFVGHDHVYRDMPKDELEHCISPFISEGRSCAEFVKVQ